MNLDLRQNQLSGTLPYLRFLARAGCRIDSVNLVWLDKAGALSTNKTATAGAASSSLARAGRSKRFTISRRISPAASAARLYQVLRSTRAGTQPGQGGVVPHAPWLLHNGA